MRTGQRWFAGTERGHHYTSILAHGTAADSSEPGLGERSIDTLLAPERSGSVQAIVNAVTREVGLDAAEWPISRLFGMAMQLERAASERDAPPAPE